VGRYCRQRQVYGAIIATTAVNNQSHGLGTACTGFGMVQIGSRDVIPLRPISMDAAATGNPTLRINHLQCKSLSTIRFRVDSIASLVGPSQQTERNGDRNCSASQQYYMGRQTQHVGDVHSYLASIVKIIRANLFRIVHFVCSRDTNSNR
jgi:hypothetical protein